MPVSLEMRYAKKGQPIVAKLSGVTQSMKDKNGWVGIFAPGANNQSYKSYQYLKNLKASASYPDSVEVGVLQESGKFDVRVFGDISYNLKVAEVPVTVVSEMKFSIELK